MLADTRLEVAVVRVGLLLPALALAGAPFSSGALAKVALKSNLAFLPGSWANVLAICCRSLPWERTPKMARFLWLTWPRAGLVASERTKGLVASLARPGCGGTGRRALPPGALGRFPANSRRRSCGWRCGRCSSAAALPLWPCWLRRRLSGFRRWRAQAMSA